MKRRNDGTEPAVSAVGPYRLVANELAKDLALVDKRRDELRRVGGQSRTRPARVPKRHTRRALPRGLFHEALPCALELLWREGLLDEAVTKLAQVLAQLADVLAWPRQRPLRCENALSVVVFV
jgi:hypothetical protein|eukprot:COSAG03_NODE_4654_length_1478_cov_2.097172_2_plen_123_part_00